MTRRIVVHPGQVRVLRAWESGRHVVIAGGWQCGKTWIASYIMARTLMTTRGGEFVVVVPDFTRYQRVVHLINRRVAEAIGVRQWLVQRKGAQDRSLIDSHGNIVYVGSGHRPITIEGPSAKAVWIEEGHEVPARAWEAALSRTAATEGRLIATQLPLYGTWAEANYARVLAAEAGTVTEGADSESRWTETETWHYEFWRSTVSPFFSRREWRRIRARLDPRSLAMYYGDALGWARPVGAVWDEFRFDRNVVTSDELPPRYERAWLGIDFGWVHPTAVLLVGYAQERIWVLDELYGTAMAIDTAVVPRLQDMIRRWGVGDVLDTAFCDPSRPDLIATLIRCGIRAVGASNAYHPALEYINIAFRNGRLLVHSACANTIQEIQAYRYSEAGRTGRELPLKEADHTCDALRYAVNGILPLMMRTLGLAVMPGGRAEPLLAAGAPDYGIA
jgi:hypothetical protein